MNSGRNVSIDDGIYQVWWTVYSLDGADPCSSKDPGYRLAGAFETLSEAVDYCNDNKSYEPLLTRLVTYSVTYKEVLGDEPQLTAKKVSSNE